MLTAISKGALLFAKRYILLRCTKAGTLWARHFPQIETQMRCFHIRLKNDMDGRIRSVSRFLWCPTEDEEFVGQCRRVGEKGCRVLL